jgi:hypothetical protein
MRLNPDEFEITGETLDDAALTSMFGDNPTAEPKPKRKGKGKPSTPPGPLTATGEAVDGDTLRLNGGQNGRLLGYDAWESGQKGYQPNGGTVPIGEQSTGALNALITPAMTVFGTGQQTYGRPVVSLGNGGADPVNALLMGGQGVAAPQYLRNDPQRSAAYMESERLGRLNRQGGHGAQVMSPDAQRKADRWNLKLRPDEEVAFNSDLPDFRPEFQRMSSEEEQDYFGFLASKSGDPNFGQADIDGYWKGKGKTAEQADPQFIEAIRKGERIGAIDYSSWDAQTLRDFKMTNAFAGMRPEIRQEYDALLSSANVTPEAIEKWGQSYGMSFDPRDLQDFVAERAKGGDPTVPIPIINPGDGAKGAAGRGFIDTLGFAGEAGGLIDAVAPEWMQDAAQSVTGGSEGFKHRETVYNSDRPFWDVVENNWRQNESILDYDETRHPYARLGGQVVGGIFIPGSAGVRGASNFAKVGAVEGGIYGFGSGDGGIGTRLMNVPGNAAIGAAGGATIGKAIDVGAPIVEKGVSKIAGLIRHTADGPELHPDLEIVGELSGDELARAVAPSTPAPASSARADMAAEPNASITGPRVADRIDVTAQQARPLSEGPSADLMQAATARVEPGDVLPRPRNELTEAEAAQLGSGPYPEVQAPRERDYLEPRQVPSARNPDSAITRRGPADLVTFARSLNGIRDESGELTAAGISNAARKGEDFAGGENRLGKLVNPEGIGIEEAAERAWREGYFPELSRPPTNAEFIAALDDTYRGVGRRFLPDDEAEIQAFEGARDQRLAVERSRQEGAPLADDIGQPATLDDTIANTPPALDPDEWNPATLKQVGNVRVDKLDSPQEISRALKVSSDITGGFTAARRGKITQAETEALASDLGMTADDLLARRKGQAFNAEEALSARRILAGSGNELVNLARRIQRMDNPGDDLLADFHRAMIRHTAIQEQVSGATAEAGRALAQFRMVANSKDAPARILAGFVGAGGGQKRLKDAAEAIITLERDPASLNRFIEAASKPSRKDKVIELWYNFLLSGPQTHAVNVLSNTMTSLSQIPEHAIAAGIGKIRSLAPGARKQIEDRIPFTEVVARTTGLIQGMKEGMREAAYAFRTGEPRDFVTKVEAAAQKAISGKKGEVIRLPSRFLTAEDELFKGMARRMELSGLAVREARKEGLRGAEGKRRAAELLNNPTDEMWEASMDYGRYVTFQRPLGPHASKIAAFTNDLPIMKAVLPFIRTPTNLFKFAIERSPAAPLLREWRRDFVAGGAKRDLAVARATVGTGMGTLFAYLAAQGVITGSAPRDKNKRALMMADGWQPYSVKIGDKYYSYQRLDPFALTIGAAADMATLGDGMSEGQKAKGAALVWASIMGNLSNKTWLAGVSDLAAAIDDPERYGGNFIDRFAGSATVPTGVAQVARTIDPTVREVDGTGEYIQSRLPGMSDDLMPKRDVWGRPIVKEGGIGPDIMSPIWTSTEKADPATWEAIRLDAPITLPDDKKNELSPAQLDRWRKLSGETSHKWVSELIKLPGYREADADEQREKIKFLMEKAREATKANVLSGTPIPGRRPEKKQRRGNRPSQSARPMTLDDLGDFDIVSQP